VTYVMPCWVVALCDPTGCTTEAYGRRVTHEGMCALTVRRLDGELDTKVLPGVVGWFDGGLTGGKASRTDRGGKLKSV
jgi:hypothetical protein